MLQAKGVQLPSWLDGAPTLVHQSTGVVSKGSVAIREMQRLSRQHPNVRSRITEVEHLSPPEAAVSDKAITQSDLDNFIAQRKQLS